MIKESVRTKQIEERVTVYTCEDGKEFGSRDEAECHEKMLELEKESKRIPQNSEGFYCRTEEDFRKVLDLIAYRNTGFTYLPESGYRYRPVYCFKNESFRGPDWYFFCCQENQDSADDYWVETLTSRKKELLDDLRRLEKDYPIPVMEETDEKDAEGTSE